MDTSSDDSDDPTDSMTTGPLTALPPPLDYRMCPRCLRAVPTTSGERYCANDGTRLLDACPTCHAPITSPYARFCVRCGTDLGPPL